MPIISKLKSLFGKSVYIACSNVQLPSLGTLSARKLYATQANLHAVVSFLADSVAQLPLKVYRRDAETVRRRDRTSVAARLLWRPNSDQTAYELCNAFMIELLLMGVATLWLLPDPDSDSGYQLRIIPREWIQDTNYETNYAPAKLIIAANGGSRIEITRSEFVQFRMYSPGSPAGYQSPLAALRQTLTEQIQADRFRTEVWRSSGRFNAYITRPKDVAPWDDETKRKWLSAFREGWGSDGENSGKMPLLEDGMEIKPYQFNAKEAQYAETKQLSREDVAAAYHVNPSLIWHTTTQTYASAKDNARALYADCLGPILQMIQQRINSFLLPLLSADPGTYVEFDLTEKLKGSFEERANILQSAVGGPWMTRNEARSDNNLPPVEGGDELITPLNVLTGGQASPQDTHMDPKCSCHTHKKASEIRIKARSTKEEDERMAEILKNFWKRQSASVLPKIGAGKNWWNEDRWNDELTEDIAPLIQQVANTHGRETAKAIGFDYNEDITRDYLKAMAAGRAYAINKATYSKLVDAMADEEPDPAKVFDVRESKDAALFGRSLALAAAGWASVHEAPRQAEQRGIDRTVEKQWITGENPRPSHQMMDGERVPVNEPFSNGAFWPGDENLDVDESAGCNCSTEVIISF